MKYALIAFGVLATCLCYAADETAKVSKGPLDGKSFVGEIGKKGETKADKDEFSFKDGTFLSTACVEYGFKESPYQTKAVGDKVTFTATPVNAKRELMNWKGTVAADTIEGTATYESKSGKEEYWFKGKLK